MQNAGKPLRVNCRVRKPSTRCFLLSPALNSAAKNRARRPCDGGYFLQFLYISPPLRRANPLTYKFYADIMLVR